MAKTMLIDAAHPEEIRVALADGKRLQEFDSETSSRQTTKGNIYLAKIIRIEPSLQAAFVEYGGNRQGFLPFGEIHPDYYQIPVADRAKLTPEVNVSEGDELPEADEEILTRRPRYQYKIQEVIKRRQIVLVQVVKEERGGKGAALTTYLTLAGRYCVLMPNSGRRSGGISRKINNQEDRSRLREVLKDLQIPEGMSVIVRTAGQSRTKAEIKRDFDFLLRQWDEVRSLTLKSIAPTRVYSEGDLVKRAIRDMYHKDVDKILVAGEEAYKVARTVMKNFMPSHGKRVQLYKEKTPLFLAYDLESQINTMFQPKVNLPSGGSLVINHAEALVAIDVNSGRSTRERHIDDTALKTNLEAADEAARQMRLRDLAGLVVIDFIDMHERKHNQQVERRLREALKADRARVQVGHISEFGLLELSRQRLSPSLVESNFTVCTQCQGTGTIRSIESSALMILRAIEAEGLKGHIKELMAMVPPNVDLYLLNQKRQMLMDIEVRCNFHVSIQRDHTLHGQEYQLQVLAEHVDETVTVEEEAPAAVVKKAEPEADRSSHRHRGKKIEVKETREPKEPKEGLDDKEATDAIADDRPSRSRKRRDRKRRRRSGEHGNVMAQETVTDVVAQEPTSEISVEQPVQASETGSAEDNTMGDHRNNRRRNRRRRGHAYMRMRQSEPRDNISVKDSEGERMPKPSSESQPKTPSAPTAEPSQKPAVSDQSAKPNRGRGRKPDGNPRPEKSAQVSGAAKEDKVVEMPAKAPAKRGVKKEPETATEAKSGEEKKPARKGWWKRLLES